MGWLNLPTIVWCAFVFILGLMVGSFLNVLVARLPFEKSILWPGSRCFSCFQAIRIFDNLPIIGYLRLGGKCRSCGASFSSRYLWVELGTGLAFLGLFILEVLRPINPLPGIKFDPVLAMPSATAIALFAYHACLLSLLIAAAVVDAEHRIIPPLIPYTGAIIGIIGGTLMPWPWPHLPSVASIIPQGMTWQLTEYHGKVAIGVQPWPFWGPPYAFAAAGTWKLGLINSLLGALAGTFVVRWVKWLFEVGFGKEALGLGDADLLMMAGAFLGWQPAVLSLFVGAFAALFVFKLPSLIIGFMKGSESESELPFGPGLAVGVGISWLAWPWLGKKLQFVYFDLPTMGMAIGIMSVGMLGAGLLLRHPEEATETTATAAEKS